MGHKLRHSSVRKGTNMLDLSELEVDVPAENRLQIHLGISPVKKNFNAK